MTGGNSVVTCSTRTMLAARHQGLHRRDADRAKRDRARMRLQTDEPRGGINARRQRMGRVGVRRRRRSEPVQQDRVAVAGNLDPIVVRLAGLQRRPARVLLLAGYGTGLYVVDRAPSGAYPLRPAGDRPPMQ